MSIDLITATHETFAPLVSQRFTLTTADGTVELLLDNIKVFEGSTVRDNELVIDGVVYPPREAFALTWVGPRTPLLESQVYDVRTPEGQTLPLFVKPFFQDVSSTLYETVFN